MTAAFFELYFVSYESSRTNLLKKGLSCVFHNKVKSLSFIFKRFSIYVYRRDDKLNLFACKCTCAITEIILLLPSTRSFYLF